MARLQILELPTVHNGDQSETPFVLVIDQVPSDEAAFEAIRRDLITDGDLAPNLGARAVLVFETTVDIPANDPLPTVGGGTTELHLDGRQWGQNEELRAAIQEEIQYAQGKLTRALSGQELAAERTDIARDMDRLAKWRDELTDALGMDRTRDWDDICNAACGIREQRDAQRTAIERVIQLHHPADYRGQAICAECSAFDFQGLSTDNTPVAHDQCGTLRALNDQQRQP